LRKILVTAVMLGLVATGACGKSSKASTASYCDFVKKNKAALAGDSLDGASDLNDLSKRVDAALEIMNASASKAPSAVKSDVNRVISAINDLQKEIKSANGDETKINQEKVQSILGNDSNVKANEAVQKFNKDNCGVDTS